MVLASAAASQPLATPPWRPPQDVLSTFYAKEAHTHSSAGQR